MKLRSSDWDEGWTTPFIAVRDDEGSALSILPKWRDEIPVGVSLNGHVVLEPEGVNEHGISLLRTVAEAEEMNEEWERRKK
jgi:hypothetical protein